MVCYRAGDGSVGLDLEKRESEYSLHVSLAALHGRFPGNACRIWQLRQRNVVVRKGVEDLCDLLEMGQKEMGSCSWWSATDLGLRLGD